MTKRLTLMTLALGFLANVACAAPIFPPAVSGTYTLGFQTAAVPLDADGVPLTPPTQSVGLLEAKTADVLVCAAMGNDETLFVSYTVADDATGRIAASGFAYANPDCTGLQSTASDDKAFHFFAGPGKPLILLQTP